MFRLWVTCVLVTCLIRGGCTESAYDFVANNPNLTSFKELLDKDEISSFYAKGKVVTIIVPTNEALAQADPSIARDVSLHILPLPISQDKFPLKWSPLLSSAPALFFSYKGSGADRKYFVNNAQILQQRKGLLAKSDQREQQVVLVVDRLLEPFVSPDNYPKTMGEVLLNNTFYYKYLESGLLKTPINPFMRGNPSIKDLFSMEGNHTFFIPVSRSGDDRRTIDIDEDIVKAHVIPNHCLYLRAMEEGIEYPTASFSDGPQGVKVTVSLPRAAVSSGMGELGLGKIQSKTISSFKNHHLGIVRSEILKANVPVKNGVAHFIRKPLMVVDTTTYDFMQDGLKGNLSRFFSLLETVPKLMNQVRDTRNDLTIFAPNNEAFAKIAPEKLEGFINTTQGVENLISLHLVSSSSITTKKVRSGDAVDKAIMSMDRKNKLFLEVAESPEGIDYLTVEGEGVNSTCIQADIGATNGVIHIIDKVLGIPFQTVLAKLQDDFDLRTTYDVGKHRNNYWDNHLADMNHRFTFFAPSKAAWDKLKVEMPSEYKQLTEGIYPVHGEMILDRHLRVDDSKEIWFADLAKEQVIKTKRGELKVEKDEATGDVYVVWENFQGKITRPDVKAINGVIHVIDTVLMRKRDMMTNGCGVTSPSTWSFLFAIIMAMVTIISFQSSSL